MDPNNVKYIYRFANVIFFMTFFLGIMSCNEQKIKINKNTIQFSEFNKEQNIIFKNVSDYKHGEPSSLYIVDNSLLIFNFDSEYFLYKYSLNDSTFSDGFLREGRGPGEVLGPSMGISGNDLWIYDITLKKILILDKSNFVDNNILTYEEYRFADEYYDICLGNNLNYFAVVCPDKRSKMSKINLKEDSVLKEYGEFKEISRNTPLRAFKDAYTSYIYMKPSGDKIVLPYRYTDAIEIFDLDNDSSFAVHGPEGFDVEWELKIYDSGSFMGKTEKTRKAFVQATVTDNYIYALYSGHYRNEENWSYGKYIYVYDWDGNPIKKITLDRYIYALAVCEDDSTLYSFDMETGYIIKAQLN